MPLIVTDNELAQLSGAPCTRCGQVSTSNAGAVCGSGHWVYVPPCSVSRATLTRACALAWVRGAVSGYAWQSDGRGTSAMATSTVTGNSKASAQPPGGAGLGMFHRSGLAASGYPPYREGDVVTCCLDQNSHPPTVRFLKNGKSCIPKDPTSAGVPIGTCLDACPMQQSLA